MSFYLRKSVRVGPLRFNLSKSGVGVSTGIKGLRVGFGPRGNYVHAGVGGVCYQSTLTPNQIRNKNNSPLLSPAKELHVTAEMSEIDSDMRLLFQNSSADQLVQEITQKMKKWTTWKGVGVFSILSLYYFHSAVAVVGLIITIIIYLWDETRKSVVLFYDFDETKQAEFERVVEEYSKALGVKKIWHIASEGAISDRKKNAGASTLVKRHTTNASLKPPSFLKSNIPIPSIQVGIQTLCFLPEKILLLSKAGVASINYQDLKIEIDSTRFIESQSVPSDAEIVDYTWRFVNKSGGPDKRFKNNTKIPVCKYETINLRSSTGLNEQIMLSRCNQFIGLKAAVSSISYAA